MGKTLKVDSRGLTDEIELSIKKERRYPKLAILIIRSRNHPEKIQTWNKPIDNVKNASLMFTDKSYLPGQTIYYRLLVYPGLNTHPAEAAIIASNPIFINYE